MKKLFLAMIIMFVASACSKKGASNKEANNEGDREVPDNLVLVKGGTMMNTKSNLYEKHATISDFYIGKYEVTQEEWTEVMVNNPSKFIGNNLPVEMVSWYDCIDYCNLRSTKEKLKPYYTIDKSKKDPNNKSDFDSLKWIVTINTEANGYRLPTEVEWEYASGGGQQSKSYKYSGGDTIDSVGWYWQNAGDKALSGIWSWPVVQKNNNKTHPVNSKKPNELGLYNMSGNVREWCEDWYEDQQTTIGFARVWRGGGWMGGDFSCESSFRANLEASGKGSDQGFRVCRNE